MPLLPAKQIRTRLTALPQWTKRAQIMQRTYALAGFLQSIEFINQVAKKAEQLNHHPDIDMRHHKVVLTLRTHDQGGITEKDLALPRPG